MAAIFETETCKRCNGCGHHSYNQITGTRCFGCAGRGYVLSKRGRAAQAYYQGLLKVGVDDLVVGATYMIDIGLHAAKYVRVKFVELRPDTLNPTRGPIAVFEGLGQARWVHTIPGQTFRREPTDADVANGLAYQANLTANGKLKAGVKA